MLSLYAGIFDPDKVIFYPKIFEIGTKNRNSRAQSLFYLFVVDVIS